MAGRVGDTEGFQRRRGDAFVGGEATPRGILEGRIPRGAQVQLQLGDLFWAIGACSGDLLHLRGDLSGAGSGRRERRSAAIASKRVTSSPT